MTGKLLTKAVVLAGALSMAASPIAITAAYAQDQGYGPPPSDQGSYNDQSGGYGDSDRYQDDNGRYQDNQGYNDNNDNGRYQDDNRRYDDNQGYDDNNPPPPPAPPNYDGSRLPPPPPGYQGGAEIQQQDIHDRMYAERAEQWARDNCVKAHGNPAAGAVVGGVIGALIGSGVAAGGHRTAGALIGGAIGAAGGAAIAGSTNSDETSPGCPPGYVAREGAPEFYEADSFYYAAPSWYRPWVYYDDEWVYRPYPYHVWYYNHYYRRHHHWDHDRDDWRDRDDRR